ncbi:glycoside hydrolase family 108 protein [Acinetobacter sp. ANC 3832]|uniref:glycoside hydrolase family 108 protein n=1 Tax=Acinetobacter sp. ANC 3832 TaxID=1977874 RepID=UPI000A355EF8|nr:glycosyl hydrolase 108 family protein [Acinetobacter sp. ANC 3832]OTG94212.1 secretion activator protein [Acinetobacter sp. ANC 3832]
MSLTFDQAFERLIGHEGKFTNDRQDRGNWTTGVIGKGELKGTKYGISAMTYPDLDIKNLSLAQAKQIYKRDWWDKINADQINPALVFQVWDFAINAGMGTAKRKLQLAVGVLDDGIIGNLTIQAINKADLNDILLKFNAERLKYYTSLSTWPRYGKGWTLRVAGQLNYAAVDN